jgi:hypothetical protein
MHFSRLAIGVVAVSMTLAAQTPQRSGNAYFCPQKPRYENPFPHAVLAQSTALLRAGIDLTKVIPPAEFQAHHFTSGDMTVIGFKPALSPPDGCFLIHIDEKRNIHGLYD